MIDRINKVSSQSVKKATGKNWDQWIAFLDQKGARHLMHKEIVQMSSIGNHIQNPWWQQTVTVGYELSRGTRKIGETATAGFEIGVQKTFPIPINLAWELITSARGVGV